MYYMHICTYYIYMYIDRHTHVHILYNACIGSLVHGMMDIRTYVHVRMYVCVYTHR